MQVKTAAEIETGRTKTRKFIGVGLRFLLTTLATVGFAGGVCGDPIQITVTAQTDTRAYDGTTDSTVLPTLTVGTLTEGDVGTYAQTFDNKNVGTAKTLPPTTVVIKNGGGEEVSEQLYRFNVNPTIEDGLITVEVPEGVTQDAQGNPNLPGELARTYQVMNGSAFEASSGLRRVVRLRWGAGEGVEHYEIWRAEQGEQSEKLAEVTGTNYFDRAVEVGTLYEYQLKGVNVIGESDFSEMVEGWCRAALDDFTGDGVSDLWYYHRGQAIWYFVAAQGSAVRLQFGAQGVMPVPADYDGDGKSDPAFYFPESGYWATMLSGNGYAMVDVNGWGGPGSVPVSGDFDGDGRADPAVYYESTGVWRGWLSGSGYQEVFAAGMGGPGWMPVPGDFDGDGITDPAVYNPDSGIWRLWLSDSNYAMIEITGWVASGEEIIPVAGDYDGIGHDVPGLYSRSQGQWYFTGSAGMVVLDGFRGFAFRPMVGDYDGDGVTDLGILFRVNSETLWTMYMSQQGYHQVSGHDSRPCP